MTTIRCSAWTILTLTLLADVAPSGLGSCRSSPRPEYAYLAVTASNCACARDALAVSVDNRIVGSIHCGTAAALSVEVGVGWHTVSAQSATASWQARTCNALANKTTSIDLGCPSS